MRAPRPEATGGRVGPIAKKAHCVQRLWRFAKRVSIGLKYGVCQKFCGIVGHPKLSGITPTLRRGQDLM
jgi:hypothetical protein